MMEPLRWNTLEEAADWLAKKTGEPWTPRRILDAGEQGLINVRAVLPPNTKQSIDGELTYVGTTIKLDGVYLDSLLKHESIYVSATCDVPMGRDGVEVDIDLTPPALVTHKDLGVSRADLNSASKTLSRLSGGGGNGERSDMREDGLPKKWRERAGQLAPILWDDRIRDGYKPTKEWLVQELSKQLRNEGYCAERGRRLSNENVERTFVRTWTPPATD